MFSFFFLLVKISDHPLSICFGVFRRHCHERLYINHFNLYNINYDAMVQCFKTMKLKHYSLNFLVRKSTAYMICVWVCVWKWFIFHLFSNHYMMKK